MEIPVPENTGSSTKPNRKVVTFAIALWALILSGILAGLVVTVGKGNAESKEAAQIRQNAYQALLPALKLVDEPGDGSNREATLLSALEIIDQNVLTIDPEHSLAIQTKDEIQLELSEIKSLQISEKEQVITEKELAISEKEQTISEQAASLDQANREIDSINSEKAALESTKSELESSLQRVNRENAELQKVLADLEAKNSNLVAANNKLESTQSWYRSTNQKLESSNKWLSSEKSKLAREVCYLKEKLQRANSTICGKDREISSLKRQIAQLKKPKYTTLPYRPQ